MKIRFNRFMKLILLAMAAVIFAYSFDFGQKSVHAYRGGPDPSRTGAPAFGAIPVELTCNSVGCHAGNPVNDGNATFQILDVPASYTAGQTYTLRVSLSRTGISRFGFQLVALDANGANVGTLATTDGNTQTIDADPGSWAGRKYIEHTRNGSAGTNNQAIWTIRWTAPAAKAGTVTFYAAGNAANNDNGTGGDFIYTTSAATSQVATVSGASFSTTAPLTANGIASAFGEDLATTTATSTDADPNTPGFQLPTTLGGTTVKVRDSANVERDAGIFYVQPTQVNYLFPAGTANGTARVTIRASNGLVTTGNVTIATTSPGIFTAASNGSGVAAADIQRVNGGQSTFQRVFNGTNAVPIVWNNANEEIYLNLYATGVRGANQSNVTVMIGGAAQTVQFAGAQSTFAGLDQINVLLNRNLAGRGNVDVVVTVDGRTANTVTINVQ
ncbi:MAG TPA: choice-of-anchor V domain-containing protein [Blastocatellia bacterium]|nr:choice-of-anchor V domain-containing protein [Blastocatellia bacterium]